MNRKSIYIVRPLQEARFCSNSRRKEFLTPQLPLGNEDVKNFDNEEVDQKIVSNSFFKQCCNGLIVLLLLISNGLFGQVQLKVDTTHIRIGEQIQYNIVTDNTKNVVFPKLALDSLHKVEVVHELPVDTLKEQLYKKYILTSFDSGVYRIPAQEILINNAHYFTDSLLIHVGTVAVDTSKQKLFPIKPIYQAPPKTWRDYTQYLWWILGVIAFLALLWWFTFRKRSVVFKKKQIILSPIEEALNHLQELDGKKLPEQEKIKEYYIELTEIVRDYIGKDVHIPTLEVTTDELITLLSLHNKSKNLGIDKERIKQLHQFLKDADLVKFAKAKPKVDKIREDRNTAELIVKDIQTIVHKPVLDEFGNEIIEETEEDKQKKINKKRRRIGIIIGVITALVLLAGSSWYYGFQYVKDSFIGHPTKELLEGKWYQSSYGHPSISLETPRILKAQPIALPEQIQAALESNSVFVYGSLFSDFYIMVGTTEYNPEVELNIDNAVLGAINNLKAQLGIDDIDYEVEDIEKNEISGKRITGNFQAKGAQMKLFVEIYSNGKALQQIVLLYKDKDPYAEKIQERIYKSVQLQKINTDEDNE